MIFHERAGVTLGLNEAPDEFGVMQPVIQAEIMVELSPERATEVDYQTGNPQPVYYIVMGRDRDDLIKSSNRLMIRGIKYSIRENAERYYVRGRFHHWEVSATRTT